MGNGGYSNPDITTGYDPNICAGFVRKEGWAIPGNDILSSPAKQPDYASCCSQCQATFGCIAFTYLPASQECSLKTNIVSGGNLTGDRISGYNPGFPVQADDYASCCSICQATPKCVAYAYTISKKLCWPKTSSGAGGIFQDDTISAFN
ncbi:unnamed protein product [Rotaria sordida]|uniref:Apple domain-containing protein n=1 Tax=Rotaria sordida TaxID=392033 RepID=A0A814RSE7_9BILA|nr:unnamed protein product [Rotaria sordida]